MLDSYSSYGQRMTAAEAGEELLVVTEIDGATSEPAAVFWSSPCIRSVPLNPLNLLPLGMLNDLSQCRGITNLSYR